MAKHVRFKFVVDFTQFFKREAEKNIIGDETTHSPTYRSLIARMKKGIRMDAAPGNDPETIKRKGKDHWLVDTGETIRKMFGVKASKYNLEVYAKDIKHSGRHSYFTKKGGRVIKTARAKNRPTYQQLMEWHNKDRYSGIFGQLPAGSQFPKRFAEEAKRQIIPQISAALSKNVKIQVKM